jgi:predicted ATPase
MIRELRLENVRLFDSPGTTFTLAPFTVFCGPNSTGKSTLLKSLLLLRQNQASADVGSPGRLRLAGHQVDFGDSQTPQHPPRDAETRFRHVRTTAAAGGR